MAHILMLPEEIKLKIIKYLNGYEIIELTKVCTEFSRLVVDREVLKNLNFSRCYKTTINHLRYISRKVFAAHVEAINLNGIYWISSGQLRTILLKFVNLKELHVRDTDLSLSDLACILNRNQSITKLSCSLKPDSSGDAYKIKVTAPITHLFVNYSTFSLRALAAFLENFSILEELWLIEPIAPPKIYFINDYAWIIFLQSNLPQVTQKLVMVGRTEYFPKKDINKFTGKFLPDPDQFVKFKQDYNGICYLIAERVSYLYKSPQLDQTKLYEKHFDFLHKFYPNILDIADVEKLLTERLTHPHMNFSALNLVLDELEAEKLVSVPPSEVIEAFEGVLFTPNIATIRKLRTLSFPFWSVVTEPQEPDKNQEPSLFKKRRTGLRYQSVDSGVFARFTEHCTEIEDCEIFHNNKHSLMRMHWQTDALKYIRNWKVLKRLLIQATDFRNGKFFIEITQGCSNLTSLRITDNSFQDKITNDLCEALPFAKNLKDFRYEREGGIGLDQLFTALSQCPSLERVYVQCRYAAKMSHKPLKTFISQAENLVFLFLYISELPEAVCKTFKQQVTNLKMKPQQIIRIRGQSYYLQTISYEDLPNCHISDLVCDASDLFRDYYNNF